MGCKSELVVLQGLKSLLKVRCTANMQNVRNQNIYVKIEDRYSAFFCSADFGVNMNRTNEKIALSENSYRTKITLWGKLIPKDDFFV